MNPKPTIYAMIPARIGSTRFKMKNLAMLNGKPMIAYSIVAALSSKVFDRVIVNSDSDVFRSIAEEYGAEFYLRPEHLGGSSVKSDDVVKDFINKWKEKLGVTFVMGVGGTFDIVAGKIKRAPVWMQKHSLEWLFRIIQEPGRMWKRYLVTNTKFAYMLIKHKINNH